MILFDRPGTIQCDACRNAWITHPAYLHDHPSRTAVRPSNMEAWAREHGWTTTTETGHLCPRCTRRYE